MSDDEHWAGDLPEDWNVATRCAASQLPDGARVHVTVEFCYPDFWYPSAGQSIPAVTGDLAATLTLLEMRQRGEAQVEGMP